MYLADDCGVMLILKKGVASEGHPIIHKTHPFSSKTIFVQDEFLSHAVQVHESITY